jgi:hypothetical protein
MYRVAVDVAQFLDSLCFAPDVEIVITRLPEGHAFDGAKFAGSVLLEHLKSDREFCALGFAHQQMDVFGHDYVSRDEEVVPRSGALQDFQKDVARFGSAEEWVAVLTAEGDEVETAGLLESGKTPGHGLRVDVVDISCCDLLKKIQ